MNIMKNKKGEGVSFFGGHVVNLVLTVIVVVILVYLGSKVYGIFTDSNELEKAGRQLEKIADVIKTVQREGKESRTEFFPIKGWFLRTFKNYNFPEGECRDSKVVSCLCICEELDCNSKRKCEGFEFDTKVDETFRQYAGISSGQGVATDPYNYVDEVLELKESAYELSIFKEEDIIKIKRLE